MLRSIWLLFVYVSFLGLSVPAPFVATLGYVWVDTFQPQLVAFVVLNELPVAMIMGIVAVGSYVLLDRRSPPPISIEAALLVSMVIWVSLTLIWAQAPDEAWIKWDVVSKTLAFAAFVPFVIRSRVQIEAFAQTYVLSLAANFVPFGLKVLISGGGYGRNLGLQAGNTGLSEGGLLSTSCLMAVPLAIFLASHTRLVPKSKLVSLGYWTIAGLAVVTAVGTYERSALVGLVILAAYMWIRSRHKVAFGAVVAAAACVMLYSASTAWNSRISTIGDPDMESSAYVRILVWKWTLGFVAEHPFGGGFQSYLINHVDVPGSATQAAHIEFGRAFHSIYFEVLGEHGYPGLAIFLALAGLMFFRLRRVSRQARAYPELQWVADLSDALQSGMAVFLTAGAFVGIAFQPMFWYFIALSISLSAYMSRVESQQDSVVPGWRRALVAGAGGSGAGTSGAGAAPGAVRKWREQPAPAAVSGGLPRP
ncbi:MAG TPA: putative O-glycosylation ligase, exosortase A system-associated [Rhodopila sp.]